MMRRRNYFDTCPDCGANLDPGERCECRTKQGQATKIIYYPAQIEGQRKRPVPAV